jgi:hypothetical protein
MVADVYYREKDLQRIVQYCLKDVVTLAQLFLKMMNIPSISDENIIFPTE